MQAIIVTGGKQYNVSEGDTLFIEKRDVNAGDAVVFDQVLAIVDGENTKFGPPVVYAANAEDYAARIEKLDQEAGDTVKFDQVLAIIDGEKATFGTPVVEGAKVDATVVKNGKGKKIRIFKYTPKKGYRKRQGHRQPYTKVEIGKITF